MKSLRILFSIGVPFIILAMVLALLAYLRATKDLPPLDSEFDVEKGLRTTIEGERRHLRGEAGIIHNEVTWPRPALTEYPHDFVVMYVAQWGCPTFFQTPRESDLKWTYRVVKAILINKGAEGRDGKCELHFARELASHLRVPTGAPQNLAAYRLRQAMQKDQLVAYDLAALPLERGYFGLHDASRLLLRRELNRLNLAELAELSIALPPNYMYEEVRDCTSPLVIRQARNDLLGKLGASGFIPEERTRAAQGDPLACERTQ